MRAETIDEWTIEMRGCIEGMLGTRKAGVVNAFKRALCLARGPCVDDMGKQWPDDVFVTFELARCQLNGRVFQLLKEKHFSTKRWGAYVRDLYTELFNAVFEDILPGTDLISNGKDEFAPCPSSFDSASAADMLRPIVDERRARNIARHRKHGDGNMVKRMLASV